jgi:anti-sigma B factor antagonist
MTFSVRTEVDGNGRCVVRPVGQLDLGTVDAFEEALASVEGEGPPVIVVDLSELSFLDSTGLRSLIGADARARTDDRRLILIPGSDSVQRVFRLTLVDRRLEFEGGGTPGAEGNER